MIRSELQYLTTELDRRLAKITMKRRVTICKIKSLLRTESRENRRAFPVESRTNSRAFSQEKFEKEL